MENKKRVLLVSPNALNNGGVQFVFMTIIRNLYKDYVFDIVVFNSYQDFYRDEFLSFGGEIFHIDVFDNVVFFKKVINKIFGRLIMKIQAKKIIKKQKYDVIHCFNQFDSDIFLKRAYKVGVKNRICRSGGCYKKTNFIKDFKRNCRRKRILKYSTELTGVSEDSCRTFYGDKANYLVINNPSNENIKFNESKPQVLTLLQIGIFSWNKNQIFTLDVVNELKKICDCKLIFIGNDSPDYLIEKINEKQLDGLVTIFPSQYDKNEAFSSSSYLIFPSIFESFGNVLIEAQNAGLKCFASDTIPRHANCGGVIYLSLERGPEYWAKIIYEEFMKNHGKKEKYDCSRFSTETFIANINALYLKH